MFAYSQFIIHRLYNQQFTVKLIDFSFLCKNSTIIKFLDNSIYPTFVLFKRACFSNWSQNDNLKD